MSLIDDMNVLKAAAQQELQAVASADQLEAWRIKYLGAKGSVKGMMQRLKEIPPADKPAAGQAANQLKNELEAAFKDRQSSLGSPRKTAGPQVDVTIPGSQPAIGHQHVLTQTINEICEIFGRMGFSVAYGPEVEDERHNFVALNIPASHPAGISGMR